MPENFHFEIDTPALEEVAVATVRCYESSDGLTAWALVDSVALATLTPDINGVYTWTAANADASKFHELAPVSAGGVERPASSILAPAPLDPSVVTVFIWAKDIGLTAVAGVRFSAGQVAPAFDADGTTVVRPTETVTDANGYASLDIPADIGLVKVTVGSTVANIDTTGLGGTAANIADYL